MENITIKADPRIMINKADETGSYVNELSKSLDEMTKRIANLETCWSGEAASEYFQIYRIQSKEIASVIKEVSGHIGELRTAAQIYAGIEPDIQYNHQKILPNGLLE